MAVDGLRLQPSDPRSDSIAFTALGLFPNLIESQRGTLERGYWPIALLSGVGLEVTPRRKLAMEIFLSRDQPTGRNSVSPSTKKPRIVRLSNVKYKSQRTLTRAGR